MSTIYLIESVRDYDTVYKIGYTKSDNAKNRITQLQTGNDGKLKIIYEYHTKYGTTLEKSLHNRYLPNKIKNEWFNLDISDVANFINTCEKIENNFKALKDNPFFKV